VEERCVGVAVLQGRDTCTLAGDRPVKRGEPEVGDLGLPVKPILGGGECPVFLRLVKAQ